MSTNSYEIDTRITRSDYVYLNFPYDRDIISYIKEHIPDRKYVPRTEEWKFKLTVNTLPMFLSLCQLYAVNLSSRVKKRIRELIEKGKKREKIHNENQRIANQESTDLIDIKGLARGYNLYDFQEVGVEYIVKNRRVILGDEPGTGKSIQIIASIHHEDAYPALIVCPNSLKGNWKNEWNMWLPRKTVKIQDSSKDLDLRSRVTVINYAILHKYKDQLIDRGFKSVALDESHYIKNADARRSKVANDIVKSIDNSKDTLKILATGTAALNRPVELVHQLKTIDRFEDEFGTFMSFAKRFCAAKSTRWGLDTSGASNTQELHKRLVGSGAYIRRNKEDVIENLPEKQRQSIYVDIDNRREYNFAEKDFPRYYAEKAKDDDELMNRLKSYANNDNELEKMLRDEMIDRKMKADANEFLMKLGALRKLATDGKMKHIRSWIDNFLESGEPLVVFAHHRSVTDMIADRYDCPKITGEVASAARTKAVDSFTDGEHQIIVLNIEAGGVGLNLHKWKGQNVTNILFAQLSWSWGELTQAENRIHRIGSDSNKVNIYYLLAENTVDEYMMDVLKNKQIVTTSVNEGRDITDDSGNIVEDTIKRIDNKWA